MSAPPVATYRLQIEPELDLDRAAALTGYLSRLGVSHLYSSPLLQATTGSKHGYDVTDPTRWSRDVGGREGLERLLAALRERGLGLVLDFVPNHMAASTENPWWRDVLENGRASRFADYFDVDWSAGPIRLPVLEEPVERRIAAGAVRVVRRPHGIVLDAGLELPLAPCALRSVLAHAARRAGSPELATLAGGTWPEGSLSLAELLESDPRAAAAVDAELAALQEDPRALAELLERLPYRLACWRDPAEYASYRRFFDVGSLVGLRVEEPRVFEHVHGAVLELCARGAVDGLRLDHVDGLRDPHAYLGRLAARAGDARLWVEKILHTGERLDPAWPVAGTTGYEVARWIDDVLTDPAGAGPLARLCADITGEERDFEAQARAARLDVLDELFAAELAELGRRFAKLFLRYRKRPLVDEVARAVVREVLGVFPVYRAYVRPGEAPSATDRAWIERATRAAAAHRRDLEPALFELLHDLLVLRWPGVDEHELVHRFQQLSPAVAAKGIEDTAFYRDLRLLALNEVGGDPGRFGASPADFHAAMQERQARWPLGLVALMTHDCKRSADVRARLLLLAEQPERWAEAVRAWLARARELEPALPDGWAAYFLFQTLVGAWPLETERARAVVAKSAREAKLATSWLRADEDHERRLDEGVERVLADGELRAAIERFVEPLVEHGRTNALAQTLLQLAVPGVPDLYQGSELWDLRLVDPDNRSPVDFELRARLLAEPPASPEEALAGADAGLPKLFLILRGLALRRERARAFGAEGDYEPLAAKGAKREHVLAFTRGDEVLAVAPRLPWKLAGEWADTALAVPRGRWRDALGGGEVEGGDVAVGELLARFPVGLLARAA